MHGWNGAELTRGDTARPSRAEDMEVKKIGWALLPALSTSWLRPTVPLVEGSGNTASDCPIRASSALTTVPTGWLSL
jgi:hypothetical protein